MSTDIVIYEDNNDFREALVQLINTSENYRCSGAFYDCCKVVENIALLKPAVVLMDIEMPERNGIEAVQLIRGIDKEVKIIMLTVFDDNKNVIAAISAGASGYLLKKNCFEKLFDAIEEVMHGGAPMSANVARLVLDHIASNVSPANVEFNLTSREKEILTQLVKGFSYKMIAASLTISFETVKTHIRNIYEKLQVHNQSEAVAKAIKNRIVK
jgi:DNA-binding NarL/FixJ family response regulator